MKAKKIKCSLKKSWNTKLDEKIMIRGKASLLFSLRVSHPDFDVELMEIRFRFLRLTTLPNVNITRLFILRLRKYFPFLSAAQKSFIGEEIQFSPAGQVHEKILFFILTSTSNCNLWHFLSAAFFCWLSQRNLFRRVARCDVIEFNTNIGCDKKGIWRWCMMEMMLLWANKIKMIMCD